MYEKQILMIIEKQRLKFEKQGLKSLENIKVQKARIKVLRKY